MKVIIDPGKVGPDVEGVDAIELKVTVDAGDGFASTVYLSESRGNLFVTVERGSSYTREGKATVHVIEPESLT